MFILKSTYINLVVKYEVLIAKYEKLITDYNSLVQLINKKGGQEFLNKAKIGNSSFSKEEIKTLITLCHPDKHCGSETATKLTQKLLSLR